MVGAAQDISRVWLVTMEDLRARWPAHYRMNPLIEKVESRNLLTSSLLKYRYIDRKGRVLLLCTLSKSASSLRAEMGYGAFNWAAHHDGDKSQDIVDYSQKIRAGEASQCKFIKKSNTWLFAYRQKKIWAYILVGGMRLTPAQMKQVVEAYSGRVAALQTPKRRPQRKGIWRY